MFLAIWCRHFITFLVLYKESMIIKRLLFSGLNWHILIYRVIDHSKENRMQVHNVAIVFGPTLIWPETVTPNLAANMIYQSRIVEYCLLEYKNIFRWRFAKKKIANHSVITSCTCIIQQRKKNQTWTILLTQHIFFFPSVQLLPTEYGKMRAKKKGIEW